jgi:predicted AAA+ superfamily ATPase
MWRNYNFHVLVSGSYLGVALTDQKYFLPADDVTKITVKPLTFREFLHNAGGLEKYLSLSLFGKSDYRVYKEMQKRFDEYMIVGGYPFAAESFLEMEAAMKAIPHEKILNDPENRAVIRNIHQEIYNLILTECDRYLKPTERELFHKIMKEIPACIVNDKRGKTIDFNDFFLANNRFDFNSIESVIFWLKSNRILSSADRAIECDTSNLAYSSRLYYTDVGLANFIYESYMNNKNKSNFIGALAENFVFLELDSRAEEFSSIYQSPIFGTYDKGEIDFLVHNRKTICTFAIDVKHGKDSSKTAIKLLSDRKVDYALYVRSDSRGGFGAPGIITIPIYLIGRFDFEFTENPPEQPSLYREEMDKLYEASKCEADDFDEFYIDAYGED